MEERASSNLHDLNIRWEEELGIGVSSGSYNWNIGWKEASSGFYHLNIPTMRRSAGLEFGGVSFGEETLDSSVRKFEEIF